MLASRRRAWLRSFRNSTKATAKPAGRIRPRMPSVATMILSKVGFLGARASRLDGAGTRRLGGDVAASSRAARFVILNPLLPENTGGTAVANGGRAGQGYEPGSQVDAAGCLACRRLPLPAPRQRSDWPVPFICGYPMLAVAS